MVNPFIGVLLVADVIGLIVWRRLSHANARDARVVLALHTLVALGAIVSVLLDDVLLNSWLFWMMLVLLNLALAATAFRVGQRGLALAGGAATLIAVALVLAHSFSSLPVAGIATALCLGAALAPSWRHSHEASSPPI